MSVKKKMLTLVGTPTVSVILTLSACGGGEGGYEYEVEGTVRHHRVDYDCPGVDVALHPVAFARSSGGSSGGGRGSSSRSNSSSVSGGGGSKSSSRSGGVKLSKKPAKPKKVDKFSPSVYDGVGAPKGCEIEYELFVDTSDGLYEQDVREEDYRRCAERGKVFPLCTLQEA